MADAELRTQHFLDASADGLRVRERQIFAEVDVRLEVDMLVVHLPDMQVVHVLNLGHVLRMTLHGVQIDALGRGLHEDVDRLADDAPRVPDDIHAHDHRDQRIEPIQLPNPDGDAAQDDSHGRERVTKQMQVSRADVQVVLPVAMQHDDRDQVGQ